MKFYNTHIAKFIIIKSLYYILNLINIRKYFFKDDFDLKKNKYHKENILEKKFIY